MEATFDNPVVQRVADDLLSGRYFVLHAASAQGVRGYEPPVRRDDWADSMATLAKMAQSSDSLAQVAAAIIGRVNLYGTKSQATASIYSAAADALRQGYTDVIGRSGPEAGRYSDHHRDFTVRERIALAFWLDQATAPFAYDVPGVGWAVQELADQIGYVHG